MVKWIRKRVIYKDILYNILGKSWSDWNKKVYIIWFVVSVVVAIINNVICSKGAVINYYKISKTLSQKLLSLPKPKPKIP